MSVNDVTASFLAVLRFRRKTIHSSESNEGNEKESLSPRRFPSVSGVSDIGAGGDKTPFRRRSTLKTLGRSIASMIRLRIFTQERLKELQPQVQYENTYRLGPDADKSFHFKNVHDLVYSTMEATIGNKKYDYMTAGNLACQVSARVKDKVKQLNIPRYRIVCQVVIVENCDQGLEAASSFLWDDKKDNYACVTYKNTSLIAAAMVYGVYLE